MLSATIADSTRCRKLDVKTMGTSKDTDRTFTIAEVDRTEVQEHETLNSTPTDFVMDGDSRFHSTQDPDSPNTAMESQEYDASDEDDELPKYQFRPQTRGYRAGFTTTWIDQDQTGDYDPSEEARKERLLRNRLKLRSLQCVRTTKTGPLNGEVQPEALVKKLPTLMVRLSFSSEAGQSRFRALAVNIPSETGREHVQTNGYHLRKRKASDAFTDDEEYTVKKARYAPDLPDDPNGHPFARGCWECASLGVECPLLTDESAWPCSTCADDHTDCDLIIPPEHKRACEGCKRRKVRCSYTYTLNHGISCFQCAQDGHECIAGPTKNAIRTRIRYDRDWTSSPMPTAKRSKRRAISACVECAEAGRPCSLANLELSGNACEACKEYGEPCTLKHLLPIPRSRTPKVEEVEAREPRCHRIQPPKQSRVDHRNNGTTKTIETKFCHPITFNCDEKNNDPCHFCEEPSYGILGMEKKEVEVIEWEDGHGLEEVSGGHKSDGVENTRMCTFCTMSRMSIIMCSEHEMRPMGEQSTSAMDENEAIIELFSGTAKKTRQWCAICAKLACYECKTPCEDGSFGCPLKLCEQCMLVLRGIFDGDLQKMLPELKDEVTDQKMLGLRADFELLKQDGLLMRYLLWSSEQ